jgi:hypothetical protein
MHKVLIKMGAAKKQRLQERSIHAAKSSARRTQWFISPVQTVSPPQLNRSRIPEGWESDAVFKLGVLCPSALSNM